MLKNKNDALYVGITENTDKRTATHNSGQGAQFTKNKPDFKLAFLEKYLSLSEARKREMQLKKWRRDKKEFLIERYNKSIETNPANN